MLKEKTRQATSSLIMLLLRSGKAVQTVKAAKEILHTEWSEEDIQLLCYHIKEHGADDWAENSWEGNVDQIYKQIYLATLKATDFKIALWLEKILGGENALKFLCSCEEKLN